MERPESYFVSNALLWCGFAISRSIPSGDNGHMFGRWYFSLMMLIAYVATFAAWKLAPARITFLIVGLAAIVVLLAGMVRAHRAGYFANRLDLILHAWVIVDLALETAAFEAFKMAQPFAVIEKFHDNLNFVGCALIFSALIGGHRWFALRKPA